jgi:hypothetical protein
VSPAEAGAVELEEPDWRERFEQHCASYAKLPRYLAEDSAFEDVLRDYRRFHFAWVEVKGEPKRLPMAAVDAIIALAGKRIFPPRNLIKDVPRDGKCYEPDLGDDHMWLQIAGHMWRIAGVESKMLLLDNLFGEGKQIDLSKAKWEKYVEAALEALKGRGDAGGMPITPAPPN